MVGDFIIFLLAFFNIFIYLFFILKKRGPERGPEGGPKRGGPERGSTFCLHPFVDLILEKKNIVQRTTWLIMLQFEYMYSW